MLKHVIEWPSPSVRVIVADGAEGVDGRALLLISAFHTASTFLHRVRVLFVRVADPAVRTAVEALAWDTGLAADCAATLPEADFSAEIGGAALFVAVAFRGTHHLVPMLSLARQFGVPDLVAVQFPRAEEHVSRLALESAAHDPRRLARHIGEAMGVQ